jgi:hypothetical protein
MTRTNWLFLLLFAAILGFAAYCGRARAADFNVLRNGAPAFCAPALVVSGSTYDFRGDCGVTPPPANRLTRANVSYPPSTAARSADLTRWEETFGRVSITLPGEAWPKAGGAAPQWTMRTNQMVCVPFTTTTVTGLSQLSMMSYYTAGNLDVSIARTCGDFGGEPACSKGPIGAYASQFMVYRIGSSTSAFCGLAPLTTYYLNIRFHNQASTPGDPLCTTIGCKVSIKSNPATR